MTKSIEDVINEMLLQLKSFGVSESTLSQKEARYCGPILKFFSEHGCSDYSPDLLDQYLNVCQLKLITGKISSKYFKAIEKNVRCIKSIAETGSAVFSRETNCKKFLPCDSTVLIIKNCLSTAGMQPDYQYKHECCLRKFFVYLEKKQVLLTEVDNQTFIRYLIDVAAVENPGSLDYVIRSLSFLIHYLNSIYQLSITLDVARLKPKSKPRRIIDPYSKDEITRIFNQIDTTTAIGRRDYALMLLAYNTGLRAKDIIKLKLSDFDWRNHSVAITQSKTAVKVWLPLEVSVMNAVAKYILYDRPKVDCNEIFVTMVCPFRSFTSTSSLDRIIEHYALKANVAKKDYRSFHSLRRSFASGMSQKQVPIATISQLLGHTSFAADRKYLSYNDTCMRECAADFSGIPVRFGTYSVSQKSSPEFTISANLNGIQVKGGALA